MDKIGRKPKYKSPRGRAYSTWRGIRERCLNPNSQGWLDYGGRGITICDEWKLDYDQFYLDMGQPPAGFSIERVDNNSGYEKSNCVWATVKEQSRNRRSNVILELNGEKRLATDWERLFGLPRATIYQRLKIGWTVEEAITTPIRPFNNLTLDGVTKTISRWAADVRSDRRSIARRLNAGLDLRTILDELGRKNASNI